MKNNAATKPVKPVRITRPADREIFGTWIRGYDTGDVAQLMSIFSDDLRYITPCEPDPTPRSSEARGMSSSLKKTSDMPGS